MPPGSQKAVFLKSRDTSHRTQRAGTSAWEIWKRRPQQVLENIRGVLACVSGTMDDIVKVTVFVTDLAELKKIHGVRSEYFSQPYPASTLVQVAKLIDPEWLIEIEADAVVPEDRIIEPLTI